MTTTTKCPTCGETPCGGGQMEEVKSGVVQCDHCEYVTTTYSEGRTFRDGSECPNPHCTARHERKLARERKYASRWFRFTQWVRRVITSSNGEG